MNANAPPNEDRDWTVCSASDDMEMDLPEAELDEADDHEWSVCAEDSEHDRCTEAMDYVNELIARMNGGDSSAPNVAPPPSPTRPKSTKLAEKRPVVSSRRPTSSPPRQKTPEPPAEPVHDGETAEEKQMRIAHRPLVMAADMKQLREAANLSMKGMLKSLDQKYLTRKAYGYLFASAGFIAVSLILLSMSPQMISPEYAASAISTVMAGLAAWKYTGVARRLADVVRSDQRLA